MLFLVSYITSDKNILSTKAKSGESSLEKIIVSRAPFCAFGKVNSMVS